MTRTQFFRHLSMEREGILAVDALIRAVGEDFKARRISATAAITRLREAGASEGEIRETIAAGLPDHLED